MPAVDTREAPGRLQQAFRRMLMRQGEVSACENVGARFRLITLEGPQLRGAGWMPGQKVQIAMGAGFAARTYTPIDWDEAAGRMRILGFVHSGDTPGGAWVRGARAGDRFDLFGPRSSLDARIVGPLAVLGDETSIGLAAALQAGAFGRPVSCRFEVDEVHAAALAVERLGLRDARLVARAVGDAHLDEIEDELLALAAAGVTFVLSGRAQAIQRLRQSLRRLAVPGARVVAKAYWAPGKVGLD